MKTLDQFFGILKEQLVPFLKKLTESKTVIEDSFLTGDYREEDQEAIGKFLAEYVGFDFPLHLSATHYDILLPNVLLHHS